MAEWDGYILTDYRFEFFPGSVILDIGCGSGDQLNELQNAGGTAFGIDPDQPSLNECRKRGLSVAAGKAEKLPFAKDAFDGILSKVVLSYTDDRKAVAEIARTLRPGGTAYLVTHGAGYYLIYLLKKRSLATRFYGLRSLFNTAFFSLTGTRLPGFLGDTIYQSEKRLSRLYKANGLEITSTHSSTGPLSCPVFTYHKLTRKH